MYGMYGIFRKGIKLEINLKNNSSHPKRRKKSIRLRWKKEVFVFSLSQEKTFSKVKRIRPIGMLSGA